MGDLPLPSDPIADRNPKFSWTDRVVMGITVALTLGAIVPEVTWYSYPMLAIAWIGCEYLTFAHTKKWHSRVLWCLVVALVFAGLEYAMYSRQKYIEERALKTRLLDVTEKFQEFTESVHLTEAQIAWPNPFHPTPQSKQESDLATMQVEMVNHNAIAEFHTRLEPSVQDLIERLAQDENWKSKECDKGLAIAYSEKPEVQFMYIEGCLIDLKREADKLP